jgi:LIVCS family branched-chain amino acid:cation transporter
MIKTVSTAGFALFSMFFGSGNLVFPFMLGRDALSSFPYVVIGLIITAVLVPILGFLGILLADGSYEKYFRHLGKTGTFIITLLMLSLMGPLGVIPRSIGLSYGGMHVIYPHLDLWVFSLIFCIFLTLLAWHPNKVVAIIGNVLTPFKLGGILLIILAGLQFAPPLTHSSTTPFENVLNGITTGYQTMDLLASFFFAASTIEFIRQQIKNKKDVIKASIYAGIIGSVLLVLVYSGFVMLAASYGPQIQGIPSECLLAEISGLILGHFSMYIVSFTIAISCLATSTILTKLFVEFLSKEILKNKVSYHASLVITLIISFFGSLLGFRSIVTWIAVILTWLYPFLIIYALFKIYEGLKTQS